MILVELTIKILKQNENPNITLTKSEKIAKAIRHYPRRKQRSISRLLQDRFSIHRKVHSRLLI
jgi:hypothetical protein